MNHKQKLGYTVLGAVIMLVGIGVGAIVTPPLVAQGRDRVFDTIMCNALVVVDEAGTHRIVMGTEGGAGIEIYNARQEIKVTLADAEEGSI